MGLENALEEVVDENGCHLYWVLRTSTIGDSPAILPDALIGSSIFTGYSTITAPTLLSALEASVPGAKIIGYTVNQQAGAAGLVAGDTGNGIALATGESFTVNVDHSGGQTLIVADTLFTPGAAGTQRIIWRYTIGPDVVPISAPVIATYWTSDVTGGAPGVTVTFDSSTSLITNCGGAPTYAWEYKLVGDVLWTALDTVANPAFVFAVAGTYDVRLTVTCGAVSNIHLKSAYIAIVTALTGNFISVLGDDTDAGTQAAPWRTFAYAKTQLAPGDVLYVLGNDGIFNDTPGDPNNEYVRWDVPGTIGNPITIKAYPGHTWQMASANYTFPNTANTSPGGTYSPYGTKAPSNFNGIFIIEASYVVLQDLEVLSSQGIGIKVEGLPATHIIGIRIYNVKTTNTYKNSIRCQFFDDLIIDGGEFTLGGYDAPFNRPTSVLNHPGCVSVKNGLGAVVSNIRSWNQFGEAIIIGDNMDTCDVHHSEFYDCMSPLGYINNAEEIDFHHNLIYDSDTSPFHADPSSGIYLNCEYALPTDINRMTNIRVWNNLVVACGTNFRIGQGEVHGVTGVLPPYSGIEVYNNSLFESRGPAPKGATIHVNVRVTGTGIKFQYNLIYQVVPGTVGTSSSDALITHWPNSWYPTPAASMQGPGDLYVNQLPIAPNASITPGAFSIANYNLSAASPAKNVLAAINALVTDDYSGNPRTSLYSFGAFE